MALEALGAVASIIAITEAVGKLGKQAIALKKLCDQVKEIPQTLQDHIDEMDRLVSVLDQMGDDLATASKFAIESRAAQQCLLYCRQAASNLEDLIMKLHAQVNAVDKKHSMGQTIIKFKVRLKKNLVDDLERKLEKSLRLLGLADSSLQRAMLMKMMVEVTVMAETRRTVKVEVRDTEPPGILTTAQEGPLELPSTGKAVTRQSYKQPTRPCFDYQELSWSRPGYLPRLCYYAVDEIATTVDNASSSCQKDKNKAYQIRFQMPFWMATKVWDFQAQRTYGGWTSSLKTWNVRPDDSEIFYLVEEGKTEEMRRAFETGSASVYDCNEDGYSLLDLAFSAFDSNIETVTMLMERNLILNDYYVSIAVALDNIMDFCPSSLQSKWLHQLTSHFTFADDNDLYYNTADLEYLASEVVDRKRWAQEDVRPQFEGFGLQVDTKASDLRNIWWMDVFAPGPVLSRLKKAGVLPFNFRKTFAIKGYDESSLGEFAAQYLAAEYALKDWRELARWIFRDAQPLEISLAQANEVWTPLAIGLMTAHRKSRERLREWLPEQDWDTKKNGKDRQWVEDWMAEEIIRLKGRVRQWVEDLDLAGVDLMEYGKLESAQLTKTNGKPIQTLLSDRFRRLEPESTWENLPYRLTYGPSPEDWDVIFMSEVFFEYEAEGWLEDFWKLVDPVESIMPGTWVDEIEYREEY